MTICEITDILRFILDYCELADDYTGGFFVFLDTIISAYAWKHHPSALFISLFTVAVVSVFPELMFCVEEKELQLSAVELSFRT